MNKEQNSKTREYRISQSGDIYYQGHTYQNVYEKKELWNDISKIYNGNFRIIKTVSNDLNRFVLELTYKNQKIILTEGDAKPLKFEISLKLNTKFEFALSLEDVFERVFKIFGKQDIIIENKEFDEKYIVQSNNKELIKRLLKKGNILKELMKHNIYIMNLDYFDKSDTYKLMTVKDRNTKDKNIIIELIELQFRIIDFFIEERLLIGFK